VHKMRRFLAGVVADGGRVGVVEVPRIIDIDRPSDLQTANAWLTTREASSPDPGGASPL